MNAGLIRRSIAFFTDFIVIASIVSVAFTIVVRPVYINSIEDFDIHFAEYERLEELRARELIALNDEEYELNEALDEGEISETEHANQLSDIQQRRQTVNETYSEAEHPEAYGVGNSHLLFTIVYHVLAFLGFHVIYMIILKGHSIGRKLMKLRLTGQVNVLTILLREFFWKFLFYIFTFGLGILLDIYMIILKTDKRTLRDYFSKTRVILEDIEYPF